MGGSGAAGAALLAVVPTQKKSAATPQSRMSRVAVIAVRSECICRKRICIASIKGFLLGLPAINDACYGAIVAQVAVE
jgi:hypothetical protein